MPRVIAVAFSSSSSLDLPMPLGPSISQNVDLLLARELALDDAQWPRIREQLHREERLLPLVEAVVQDTDDVGMA